MTDTPVESDLFGTANARGDANSITLLRILDVQYALLAKADPEAFKKLVELHREGGIMGPNLNFNPSKNLDQGA